jgi:acetyl/propionyl-CoA carboxylase alpha subunit
MNYYFLEMNTRLQVEHPVTEMVTGIDLCKMQIRVASGKHLRYNQEDIQMKGHAIEVRIYSEDVLNNFLPTTGKIRYLKPPDGFGVREDSGIHEGGEISIHYDPMISKLIVHDWNREAAIRRMKRALEEYQITGVRTTIPFGLYVMENKAFQSGNYDTSFVERELNLEDIREKEKEWEEFAALAVAWKRHVSISHGQVAEIRTNGHTEQTVKSNNWKYLGREAAHR